MTYLRARWRHDHADEPILEFERIWSTRRF
jgi:hypothetical protein